MIKEAYVSFETAKLLKEKGFDECIFEFYEGDRIKYARNDEGFRLSELPDIYYPHITHQMACAWLREKHLIHVYAEHKAFFQEKPKKLYYHWIPFIKTLPNCPINKSGFPKDTIYLDVYCDNYENAVEEAIKYVLENLL